MLYSANNIIDVPDKNVPFVYNLGQVESQQIAADQAVSNALKVVTDAKSTVAVFQANQAKAQLAWNLANNQANAAENTVSKAQ